MKGLTLDLEFKLSNSMIKLVKILDEMIVNINGKLYLAKNTLMSENTFKKNVHKIVRISGYM